MDARRILAFACFEAGLLLVGLTMGFPWSDGRTDVGTPEYNLWTYEDGRFRAWYAGEDGDTVGAGRGLLVTGGPLVAAGFLMGLAGSILLLLRRGRAASLVTGGSVLVVALGATLLMVGIRDSTRAIGGTYGWSASLYLAILGCVLLAAAAVLGWRVRPASKRPQVASGGPRTFRMTQPPPAKAFQVDPPTPGKRP